MLLICTSLNPIFDEDSKATFVLECSAQELHDADGLVFEVKDWDRGIGGNDPLGEAKVPFADLYSHKIVEGKEYPIAPPAEHAGKEAGYITVKCEPKTDENSPKQKTLLRRVLPKMSTPEARPRVRTNTIRVTFQVEKHPSYAKPLGSASNIGIAPEYPERR